jgi:hypothetical protein
VLQDRLEDESRRPRELRGGDLGVRASFDLSLRMLPDDASRAFCLLGLLGPRTVPGRVVEPLLDRPGADDVVDALIDANLLHLVDTDSIVQPRYRLHDILRDYAAEAAAELPLPERHAAVTRALGAWLALAEQARDLMYPSMFRSTPGHSHRRPPEAARRIVADPVGWFDVARGHRTRHGLGVRRAGLGARGRRGPLLRPPQPLPGLGPQPPARTAVRPRGGQPAR